MGKVVFRKLVKEEGVKKKEWGDVLLGSVEMDSPPRAKGTLVFFNEKLFKIYKTFDWVYLNDDGRIEDYRLELILEAL